MNSKHHYVYVLLDTESDMKYIGVRSCECAIEDDPYMGSSYAMTKEDKTRCDKLVLEKFTTRLEAAKYEIELHERFQVHTNKEYWNQAKQTSTKFVSNRKGCTLTEEHKAKCSAALKGKKLPPFSDEHRRKISEARIGTKASEETKAKLSAQRQGKANSNFKHGTIYVWEHRDGEVFEGLVTELINQKTGPHNCSHPYAVVNGKRNYAHGWKIVGAVISS